MNATPFKIDLAPSPPNDVDQTVVDAVWETFCSRRSGAEDGAIVLVREIEARDCSVLISCWAGTYRHYIGLRNKCGVPAIGALAVVGVVFFGEAVLIGHRADSDLYEFVPSGGVEPRDVITHSVTSALQREWVEETGADADALSCSKFLAICPSPSECTVELVYRCACRTSRDALSCSREHRSFAFPTLHSLLRDIEERPGSFTPATIEIAAHLAQMQP